MNDPTSDGLVGVEDTTARRYKPLLLPLVTGVHTPRLYGPSKTYEGPEQVRALYDNTVTVLPVGSTTVLHATVLDESQQMLSCHDPNRTGLPVHVGLL